MTRNLCIMCTEGLRNCAASAHLLCFFLFLFFVCDCFENCVGGLSLLLFTNDAMTYIDATQC